mmetsp:Transcript_6160/g.17218  ORF Transcript_6160/g.17218 Transcript_6160/m.17218 type:complete len:424 (-) Transcript_6160:128-1399(-)
MPRGSWDGRVWLQRYSEAVGSRNQKQADKILDLAWAALPSESRSRQVVQVFATLRQAGRLQSDDPLLGVDIGEPEFCKAAVVRQIPGCGRGLIAQKDIARGEKLFWQRPSVWIAEPSPHQVCAACLRVSHSSKDGSPWFCERRCHNLDNRCFRRPLTELDPKGKVHVDAILDLQSKLWDRFPGVIGLVLYTIAAFVQEALISDPAAAKTALQHRGLLPTPTRESLPQWEHLGVPGVAWDSVESRLNVLAEAEAHFLTVVESLTSRLKLEPVEIASAAGTATIALRRLLGSSWSLSELFGQVDTVLMWVGGGKGQVTGVAIVPCIALLNHSCLFNLTTGFGGQGGATPQDRDEILPESQGLSSTDAGLWLWCEATRDILRGEELTISYVNTSDSLLARQTVFKQFDFECRCARCVLEAEVPLSL